MKNSRDFLYSAGLLFCITLLSACTGGSGSNNNDNNGVFDIRNYLPFRIVTLDNQTGSLTAGSRVPLVCVIGGSVLGGHGLNCPEYHLHNTISIFGIGGPYNDPNQDFCGHGKLSFATYNALSHRCNFVENASVNLIVNEFAAFNIFIMRLFLPGQTSPDMEVDITTRVNLGGAIPLEEIVGSVHERIEFYGACYKGYNADTGENDYDHLKIVIDYAVLANHYINVTCAPYSLITSALLNIDVSNTFTSARLFTGSRALAPFNLNLGLVNPVTFDVRTYVSAQIALLLANTLTTNYAHAQVFNPQGNETITVDDTTLTEMPETDIDDNLYFADTDYWGVKANALGINLSQTYAELDGSTPDLGNRTLPTISNLDDVGGTHKFKAYFSDTEPVTNRVQKISISKYYSMPPAEVVYSEPKPSYITDGDVVRYDSPSFAGFTLNTTYDPGVVGQELVKTDVRAETFDSMTLTRHKWKTRDFTGSPTIDSTYPTNYLSGTGTTNYAPVGDDVTRLNLSYSDNKEVAMKYSLSSEWPLKDRDYETSIRLQYSF